MGRMVATGMMQVRFPVSNYSGTAVGFRMFIVSPINIIIAMTTTTLLVAVLVPQPVLATSTRASTAVTATIATTLTRTAITITSIIPITANNIITISNYTCLVARHASSGKPVHLERRRGYTACHLVDSCGAPHHGQRPA